MQLSSNAAVSQDCNLTQAECPHRRALAAVPFRHPPASPEAPPPPRSSPGVSILRFPARANALATLVLDSSPGAPPGRCPSTPAPVAIPTAPSCPGRRQLRSFVATCRLPSDIPRPGLTPWALQVALATDGPAGRPGRNSAPRCAAQPASAVDPCGLPLPTPESSPGARSFGPLTRARASPPPPLPPPSRWPLPASRGRATPCVQRAGRLQGGALRAHVDAGLGRCG